MPSSKTKICVRAIRGRTHRHRLRLIDAYIQGRYPRVSRIADIGFGADPGTVQELAKAIPGACVVGLESDASRLPDKDVSGTYVWCEGFDLPDGIARFDLVRAMNVLRGYGPKESTSAHCLWARWMDEGRLIEGTTSPLGELATFFEFSVVDGKIFEESLVFAYVGSDRGFAPWMFRDWLPQRIRRDVVPGTPLHRFFEDWTAAWATKRSGDVMEEFQESSRGLLAAYAGTLSTIGQASYLRWDRGSGEARLVP